MGVAELTAQELESLRQAVRREAVEAPAPAPMARAGLRRYDFRIPDKFPKDLLRQITHLHDSMARALTTSLSAQLRATVRVEEVMAEQRTYQAWIQEASDPAILAAFSCEPLVGSALLEVDPIIAFPMIDRLLGGSGEGGPMNRPTTEIELTVVGRILQTALGTWRDAWSHVQPMRPKILGVETNPLFAQVVGPSEIVLALSLVCGLGRREGRLRLCLPFAMIEPLVHRLAAGQWRVGYSDTPGSRSQEIRGQLGLVEVPVSVRLATVRLPLRRLSSLQPGDLLTLGVPAGGPAQLLIRGLPKYQARVGRQGRALAVQILAGEGGDERGER